MFSYKTEAMSENKTMVTSISTLFILTYPSEVVIE